MSATATRLQDATPADLYAHHWADEQAGTPHPSRLRALALAANDLTAMHVDDARLGAAIRQLVGAYLAEGATPGSDRTHSQPRSRSQARRHAIEDGRL